MENFKFQLQWFSPMYQDWEPLGVYESKAEAVDSMFEFDREDALKGKHYKYRLIEIIQL